MKLLLTVLMLMCTSAQAQDRDFRGYLDQAKFFIKKEWYPDAQQQLELAVQTDDGRVDPEAWYMLASVRYQRCDVPGAMDAAGRAHSYSRTDTQLQQAAGLSQFLLEQFGTIELNGLQPGQSRLHIRLDSTLFDPALKDYLSRLDALVSKPVMLPYRLGLPAGDYVINGTKVKIEVGADRRLIIERDDRGPVAVQRSQIELSTGVSAWFGKRTANLLPAPSTEIAVSQPIGRVVSGVMVGWSPRPYRTLTEGITIDPNAFSVGARVGIEWPGTEPMALRTSIGYRYGLIPGAEQGCVRDDPQGFVCGGSAAPSMLVYPVARAHIPMAEVVFTYQDRNRNAGIGVGLKAAGEVAFATLPKQAQATVIGTGSSLDYTVRATDRSFTAVGVRLLANVLVGF